MKNETYNGWTNYSTWRVNLEMFDGMHSDIDGEKVTSESCRAYAEDAVLEFGNIDSTSLAGSYALAFLDKVNWHEIADHLNEE